jgi:hypothetical protein
LTLPITLCCLSTDRPAESLKILERCLGIFPRFEKTILFSSFSGGTEKIEIKKVPVDSYEEYNRYIIEKLGSEIETDFCLIVQDDGFIVNPDLWDEDFLNYDYIGAPWPWHQVCGNGGFSLRSKKLLNLSQKLKYDPYHEEYDCAPEDWFLCVKNRKFFEENGIKFAPLELAQNFSFETRMGFENEGFHSSFGFHGKQHLL